MAKQIKLSNIERYLQLFDNGNNVMEDIKWLEPVFVSMVSAYAENVDFIIKTDNIYLQNMLNMTYKENNTYSPVEKIYTRDGLEEISTHLTKIMMKNFSELCDNDLTDLKQYLQYLFLELMNNVADHSQSIGHVMTQYYPTNKKVQFAIADRGVGFLSNLKLKFPELSTEEDAIFKALEKGVTATPQKMYGHEKNAGYGLYAMVEILKQTKGQFVIISNDTMIRYKNGTYSTYRLEHKWTGVVVAFRFDEAYINFSMEHFAKNYLWNDLEEEEDFF